MQKKEKKIEENSSVVVTSNVEYEEKIEQEKIKKNKVLVYVISVPVQENRNWQLQEVFSW